MNLEIITKEDLKEFKSELLTEIRQLIQPGKGQSKQWLKSVEVRKLLNISPGTLQNLRINGTLNYTRIGSIIYYKQDDINKLSRSQTQSPWYKMIAKYFLHGDKEISIDTARNYFPAKKGEKPAKFIEIAEKDKLFKIVRKDGK